MKRFIEAAAAAVESGNLYAAVSLALILPEICASLEDPAGLSKKRYLAWFNRWAVPIFTSNGRLLLTADDCYQLRCSIIHSGSADLAAGKGANFSRVLFYDDSVMSNGNTLRIVHADGQVTEHLQVRADWFCSRMIAVANIWDHQTASDPAIQREKAKLLSICSRGDVYGDGSLHIF